MVKILLTYVHMSEFAFICPIYVVATLNHLAELNYLGTVVQSVMQNELEPVVFGRVVAGGNHYAGIELQMLHRKIDYRRRDKPKQRDRYSALTQPCHKLGSKFGRRKTYIEA